MSAHFLFCRTLPCSANFGTLEMENRAFCKIWAGKEKHPKPRNTKTPKPLEGKLVI